MEFAWIIAFLGWLLALAQFLVNVQRRKEEAEAALLEKTLGYFERGAIGRSIGISLVEGVWLKRNRNLALIVPVLGAQLKHLFFEVESEREGVETNNVVRLLCILEKSVEKAGNPMFEWSDVSDALIRKVNYKGGVPMGKEQLRYWFEQFNSGDSELFDIETANS